MKKKQINIKNKILPIIPLVVVILIWQFLSMASFIPSFMLPSPIKVVHAFTGDFKLLMTNGIISLVEALIGLSFGLVAAVILAVLMDKSKTLMQMITPLLLITQTIPTVALAPLLILWFGYGMLPKIILIFLTCFFPITMGILGGFAKVDIDSVRLLQSMGASQSQIYYHLKFPEALPSFFSSLKVSTSYAFVGAVIAEWLGGDEGLGVYMTRVRKSYSYDKMFAAIILIVIISLLLMKIVELIEKRAMPWRREFKQ